MTAPEAQGAPDASEASARGVRVRAHPLPPLPEFKDLK